MAIRFCGQLAAVIVLALLTSACSSTLNRANWPAEIPENSFFRQAWQLDRENASIQSEQEYLGWVVSFYEGSIVYSSGWQELVGQVQALDGAQDRAGESAARSASLRELGQIIAAEWAKHNDVRKIDSRMLSLWGSIIQLTPDVESRSAAIDLIDADVQSLLAGELDSTDISDARYAQALNLELFEDF